MTITNIKLWRSLCAPARSDGRRLPMCGYLHRGAAPALSSAGYDVLVSTDRVTSYESLTVKRAIYRYILCGVLYPYTASRGSCADYRAHPDRIASAEQGRGGEAYCRLLSCVSL